MGNEANYRDTLVFSGAAIGLGGWAVAVHSLIATILLGLAAVLMVLAAQAEYVTQRHNAEQEEMGL